MVNDITLTLNALTARDSGKDVRRTAENQAVSPRPPVEQTAGNQPAADAARAERMESRLLKTSKEQIEGAVKQMQDFGQMLQRELQFDLDDDLGRMVVRVIDKDSGDLIRQIPSDEILEMAKQLKELKAAEQTRLDGKGGKDPAVGLLLKIQA